MSGTKTVSAEVDSNDVAKVQKKLDAAKVKLARENGANADTKAVVRAGSRLFCSMG